MIHGRVVDIKQRPMGWEYTIIVHNRALTIHNPSDLIDAIPASGSVVELQRVTPDSGEALKAMNEGAEVQSESMGLPDSDDGKDRAMTEEEKLLELIDSMERREMESHWKQSKSHKARMYNELRRAVRWQLIEDEDG